MSLPEDDKVGKDTTPRLPTTITEKAPTLVPDLGRDQLRHRHTRGHRHRSDQRLCSNTGTNSDRQHNGVERQNDTNVMASTNADEVGPLLACRPRHPLPLARSTLPDRNSPQRVTPTAGAPDRPLPTKAATPSLRRQRSPKPPNCISGFPKSENYKCS